MLDHRIIVTSHLEFGLKATSRFPLKTFEEAFTKVKCLMRDEASRCKAFLNEIHAADIEKALQKEREFDVAAHYEKAIGLQLLGLLGKDPGHVWSTARSNCDLDAPGEIHSVTRVPGESVPYLNVRTKLLGIETTKPWKLIVLNGEQISVRELRRSLAQICPVPFTMYGERVDCIYFDAVDPFETLFNMEDKLKELRLDDKYKISQEPAYLVPTNPKSAVGEDVSLARVERAEWLRVFETNKTSIMKAAKELQIQCCPPSCVHWDDCKYVNRTFARLVVASHGGYISGAAGVGKTTLIKEIKEEILRDDPDAHIISMALTHVAARLAQGCTIAHALRKFAKVRNAWVFVDECSQVPL
jgi:hypothetical protein